LGGVVSAFVAPGRRHAAGSVGAVVSALVVGGCARGRATEGGGAAAADAGGGTGGAAEGAAEGAVVGAVLGAVAGAAEGAAAKETPFGGLGCISEVSRAGLPGLGGLPNLGGCFKWTILELIAPPLLLPSGLPASPAAALHPSHAAP